MGFLKEKRILVTGAGGALGSALLDKISGCEGAVLAVDIAPKQPLSGVSWHAGDIRHIEWRPLLKDCDAVVHTAAFVHRSATSADSISECHAVNTDATVRLARDCRDVGVPLLFVSTIAVYGQLPPDYPVTESHPCKPCTPYGISKFAAEIALSNLREDGLRFTTVRFPLLYGPSGHGNLETLLRAIRRHRYWPIHSTVRKSLVYIPDAAESIARVLEVNAWTGNVYHVAPEESPTLDEIQQQAFVAMRMRMPPPLPPLFPKLAATALDQLARAVGHKTAVRNSVDTLLKPAWSSGDKFHQDYGYWPATSLADGLRRTVGALKT